MTARPRASGRVRYGGGDDRALRLALLEEWGWTCYWCGVSLLHHTAQIDHIIARTVAPTRLAELIRLHQLPALFDLHGPANLGPICVPCNNRKRNNDYLEAPVVYEKLVTARRRAPAVTRRYQAYHTNVAVGRALVEASTADLAIPQARMEFLANAPAVVQTLALLDENQADFVVQRNVGLHFGESGRMSLALDARGRARYAWVEEICGRPWHELIKDGMRTLAINLDALLEQGIRNQCGATASALSSCFDEVTASMEIADLSRDGSLMTCQVIGQLEAHCSALVHDADSADPDLGIVHIDVEAHVVVRLFLTVSWDLAADAGEAPTTAMTVTDSVVDVGADRMWK